MNRFSVSRISSTSYHEC